MRRFTRLVFFTWLTSLCLSNSLIGALITTRAYIVNQGTNTVDVVDTTTTTVINSISFPGSAILTAIAITPDTTKAYVLDNNSPNNALYVIDTATNTFSTITLVAQGGFGLAITPDGTKVYVGMSGS